MSRLIKKIGQYYLQLGVYEVIKLLAALFFSKLPGWHPLFALHLPGIKYPVRLRFGTSDVWVVKEVLLDGEYDFLPRISPKAIVDAGANIGLAAIFFANKFPNATIYALEPEESNYKIMEINVSKYPQIRPFKLALWNKNKQVSLINPDCGHWGFTTRDGDSAQHKQLCLVDAVRLDTFMDKMNLERIDILKIDIEGAEKEVFESSAKWIGKIQIIMVELHDRYRAGCEKAFAEATQEFRPEVVRGQIVMRLHPTLAA
jgi:FkbM family methyltransferase